MKKLILSLASFFLINISNFSQVANHVVIAEVYPGGGNTGAFYKQDYIVLYNPTSSPVNLSSWSIQYAPATDNGTGWRSTALSGFIQANSYYLIQERAGTKVGAELPLTPNLIDSIALSSTGGKIALVSSLDNLLVQDPNGVTNVMDFIGYGSTVNAAETKYVSAPDNNQSLRRKDNNGLNTYGTNGSGWDSDNNSLDFYKQLVDSTNPPLPVELISFVASIIENNHIRLSWQTQTELNNYGFEIQRLTLSSKEWETIGFIKGQGNSKSLQCYDFIDSKISSYGKYSYRLKQVDLDGSFIFSFISNIELMDPVKFNLVQNYPNPFNPSTIIEYNIPEECFVDIDLFNVNGMKVLDLFANSYPAGNYKLLFNGAKLASGIYFYRVLAIGRSKTFSMSKKMILLR
ncbi:MAG: lamin tail domain-containing protein [Ignavibacteriaceae bacterium]